MGKIGPELYNVSRLAAFARAARGVAVLGRSIGARWCRGPSGPRKVLALLDRPPEPGLELLAAYQTAQALFPRWAQDKLLAQGNAGNGRSWYGLPLEFLAYLQQESDKGDVYTRISHYALCLLLGQRTLRDTASMSMGVSLEVRAPFTDHVLVETVWQVRGTVRCRGAPNKPYQVELTRPYLGHGLPVRRKQGFVFPFQSWLHQKDRHLRDVEHAYK